MFLKGIRDPTKFLTGTLYINLTRRYWVRIGFNMLYWIKFYLITLVSNKIIRMIRTYDVAH